MKKILIIAFIIALLPCYLLQTNIRQVHAENSYNYSVYLRHFDMSFTDSKVRDEINDILNNESIRQFKLIYSENNFIKYCFEFSRTRDGNEDILYYRGSVFGVYFYELIGTKNWLQPNPESVLVNAFNADPEESIDISGLTLDLILTNTDGENFTIYNLNNFMDDMQDSLENLEYSRLSSNKVIFDSNGGTNFNDLYFLVEQTINLPTPIKEGFKFLHWQDEEGNIYTDEFTPSSDILLTAVYKQTAFTLSVFVNNEIVHESTIDNGTEVTIPDYELDGYNFLYWQDEEGNTYNDLFVMPENDLTLTGVFETIDTSDDNISDDNTGAIDDDVEDENNEDTSNNTSSSGSSNIWDGFSNFFKNIGKSIAKTAKNIWDNPVGKTIVIGAAAIAAIAATAGIIGAVAGASGIGAAVGAGLKVIASKAVIPFLKFFVTPKGFLTAGLVAVGVLAVNNKEMIEAAIDAAEKTYEVVKTTIEFIDKNIVDPLADGTGAPKILLWIAAVATGFGLISALHNAIKHFFKNLFIRNKKEKK